MFGLHERCHPTAVLLMNKKPLTMTNQSSIRLPFSYTASGHTLIEPLSDF